MSRCMVMPKDPGKPAVLRHLPRATNLGRHETPEHVGCGYLSDVMYATTASSSADSRGVAGMGCFGVVIKSLSLSAVMLGRAAIALKLGAAAPCTVPPMA
jgi:hypothetical protein